MALTVTIQYNHRWAQIRTAQNGTGDQPQRTQRGKAAAETAEYAKYAEAGAQSILFPRIPRIPRFLSFGKLLAGCDQPGLLQCKERIERNL
jgi:hypothetical protein